MMYKVDCIQVKINTLKKELALMNKLLNLNGKARLIRDETNIPNTSKLGILSLCDGKPFTIKFIDTADSEIEKFKDFEC